MFCKHSWKMLSETITESKFEHSAKQIKMMGLGREKITIPWQLSDASRKHIQVFTCEKCGKMRRYVEKI